jgi:hypothetical protein
MWVDNDVPNWLPTLKNFYRSSFSKLTFCGIVVAILKMETGRNFSMSGINSGHHYLPTYQILMISTIPHKFNIVRFQRPELIPDIEKFLPVSIFKLAIKCWWYRTMLNFHRPFCMPCFGSHFENGRHLENFDNAEKHHPLTHYIGNYLSKIVLH